MSFYELLLAIEFEAAFALSFGARASVDWVKAATRKQWLRKYQHQSHRLNRHRRGAAVTP